MSRLFRICLMILGPAPLGLSTALLFLFAPGFISEVVESPSRLPSLINRLPSVYETLYVIGIAYLVTGLPSLIYAGIMEFAIVEGMDPRGWKSVGISTLLGAMSGTCMGLFLLPVLVYAIVLGAWVGLVIGLIIKVLPEDFRFHRRRRKRRGEKLITYD